MGISTISIATCDLCRTEIDRRENGAPVNTTNSGRLSFSLNPLAGDPGAQIELLTCRPCARKVIDALRQLGAHVAEIDFKQRSGRRNAFDGAPTTLTGAGAYDGGAIATPGYEPAFARNIYPTNNAINGFGPLAPIDEEPMTYDQAQQRAEADLVRGTTTSPRRQFVEGVTRHMR